MPLPSSAVKPRNQDETHLNQHVGIPILHMVFNLWIILHLFCAFGSIVDIVRWLMCVSPLSCQTH